MTTRIVLGSFEVPNLGGSSTASFSLFARMQSEGRDVHYVNLIHADKARFTHIHGKNVGNPRELSNVTNCWLSGNLDKVHPQISAYVDSISPTFAVGFGYIAALLLKRAMPKLAVVLVIGSCRQAQDYVTSGRVKDATSLLHLLTESNWHPRLLNRMERASVEGCDFVISHSALALEFMDNFYAPMRRKLYRRIVWFAEWICDDAVRERHRARAFEDRDIDVLFVASDWKRPEKNFPLLRAIAKSLPGKAIHVVGNMPRRLKGVTGHGFLPDRGELFDLLGRSRAVVCPSLIDAAPGILFEASVLGCNVVASRNCGNWELCHPDLLVDPFHPAGFVQSIERALVRKYDDNLEKFLSLRSYEDLMATLDTFGRPFQTKSSQ